MEDSIIHNGIRHALIGDTDSDFWLHSKARFDLTRPKLKSNDATLGKPTRNQDITLPTRSTTIKIDPSKTALVIIDMQNFFLSEAFGRDTSGPGHAAMHALLNDAIPAARKAGIQIMWLNWGLTDQTLKEMPPGVRRAFGFREVSDDEDGGNGVRNVTQSVDGTPVEKPRGSSTSGMTENGKPRSVYKGMGSDCGSLQLPSGQVIDAGRLLMRDTWNAALYDPLQKVYEEGKQLPSIPDVWIHKDRMSGFWGASTDAEDFCNEHGLRTLIFTGVNTDQCVSGSLTDAFNKGFDCVLLSDGCGTTSPDFAKSCVEYNSNRSWGFVSDCESLKAAVENSLKS